MRGFTVASLIVLVVVVAVIGIAAVLLARTVQEAQSINAKAQNIATSGKGINTATDSVIQLTRTNELAESILKSAKPLDTQLGGIVSTAQGIDGLAGSINSTAGSINGLAGSINDSASRINTSAGSINSSAGTINATAGSINTSAGRINSAAGSINSSAGSINVSAGRINGSAGNINNTAQRIDSQAGSINRTARQVDKDVRLINENLDVTLGLVRAVKGDTANILGQAGGANDTAACIDRKLLGQAGDDGDCQGMATPTATQRSLAQTPQLSSPEALRELLPEVPPAAGPTPTPAPAPAPGPAPAPPTSGGPAPQPVLPNRPLGPVNDIINGLPGVDVPGVGPGGNDVPPPGDLLRQLLPGLG